MCGTNIKWKIHLIKKIPKAKDANNRNTTNSSNLNNQQHKLTTNNNNNIKFNPNKSTKNSILQYFASTNAK